MLVTIKEHQLIKAVSNVGALPGFLTMNEVVSGVVATTACGIFGGMVMLLQAAVRGGTADALFAPVRAGAIAGLVFAGAIMAFSWFYYALEVEDETARIQFAKSGLAAAIIWIVLWLVLSRPIYAWFKGLGPLVGTQL